MVGAHGALYGLVGEFREYVFQRIFSGVAYAETAFHGVFSHCQRAAVHYGRLYGQACRLGGCALHEDACLAPVGVGEHDSAGVAACCLRRESQFELYLRARRES